jgi:mannose-6-phosphate isomerase-like protein (cupin superfamily)
MSGIRRVVTGHDSSGRSCILSDGPTVNGIKIETAHVEMFEVWSTAGAPAPITLTERDPTFRPLRIAPDALGTCLRVADLHPGEITMPTGSEADISKTILDHGNDPSIGMKANAKHPTMHRTETIDYGIVLQGEVWMVMDSGETLLRQGDIAIQRGTNHAFENRSNETCRIAFVIIDGKFSDDLRAQL